MSDNPYHKEAGHHKPVITISLADLTPAQRFALMFSKADDKRPFAPYTTLNAVATNGCQANIARPL